MVDPVKLEIFKSLFHSIAEEMGATLRRTAYSPNIKERRDYSCAVFDKRGRMVAQGDHMPVHLGSMPLSVAAAIRKRDLGLGDMIVLNDPYEGGTHLPDITLVSGVFRKRTLLFYVACRAHHSDVGGMSPGSMPLAEEIYQEGLRIPPVTLMAGGKINRDVWDIVLANVRTPGEREGDLAAMLAANRTGERRLFDVVGKYGWKEVEYYISELLNYTERMTRHVISQIPNGTYRAEDVSRQRWDLRGPGDDTRTDRHPWEPCTRRFFRIRSPGRRQYQCRVCDHSIRCVLCFSDTGSCRHPFD